MVWRKNFPDNKWPDTGGSGCCLVLLAITGLVVVLAGLIF